MLPSAEVQTLPKRLRNTLSELMTEAVFEEKILCEDRPSSVLMLRHHAVTAFAVGGEEDYEPLYEAFKKYYVKNTSEWVARDISFVFCIPEEIKVTESFRSRVEVDVYFCRKHVVHLGQNLAMSLAKLPFLPLSPISSAMQMRPPSAQTLLRQQQLKPDLASALVVPAKSSANSILDACLRGVYGAPEWSASSPITSSTAPVVEDRRQTVLKSISIQNFRAYRNEKEFKFGSAITILYGPNGFGKTSFFDAIDFVVTGGVGRLAKAGEGLFKAAKHLDCGEEPTKVALKFERDGIEHVITRQLADPNSALLDGKLTSRKDVMSLLTGGTSATADRVENMVALFRATHLFSQDSQELTQDVMEKCELPSDIVSRMLAFEDYVSGLKKAEEVLKLARNALSESQKQIAQAEGVIKSEQDDLKRLGGIVSESNSPEMLKAWFEELHQAIEIAGFDLSDVAHDDTKAIRAALEFRAAEASDLLKAASKALEDVGSLVALREQLQPILVQVEERSALLEQAQNGVEIAAERLVTLTSEHAEAKAKEEILRRRRDWIIWAKLSQPKFNLLNEEIQTGNTVMSELTQRLDESKEIYFNTSNLQQTAVATVQSHQENLHGAEETRKRLHILSETAQLWKKAEPRFIEAGALVSAKESAIESLQYQLKEAQQQILGQETVVARCERDFDSAKNDDSILKGLIIELRMHIDGATCLLCNHVHESKDKLLAEIDRRLGQAESINQLSEALLRERSVLQDNVRTLDAISQKLNQEEQQLAQLKNEIELLNLQQLELKKEVAAIGLTLSNDTHQEILDMERQAHEAEVAATEILNESRQQLADADQALVAAQNERDALQREYQSILSLIEDKKSQLEGLMVEANRGEIDLATEDIALEQIKQNLDIQIAEATLTLHSATAALELQQAVNASAKAGLAASRTNHQQVIRTKDNHQTKILTLVNAISASGFESDVSSNDLHKQIKIATDRKSSALNLREQVSKIEVGLDTVATSAAFQNVRERIRANEILLSKAQERANQIAPWVTYFERITKILNEQQALATKHFIAQYGPRTAVIQQRLRPVYGFGKIEVSSKDSAIGIRVYRNSEPLKPTDYFSQSQVQTLVLGLFLTACSSQTWSGFSSIMMDDPVTHFDDLNTYALLDLIAGLQRSPEGERQFVISTCDEKMLQLARQKFKHMGDAAKFYRFSAIGAEGPLVNEIPT